MPKLLFGCQTGSLFDCQFQDGTRIATGCLDGSVNCWRVSANTNSNPTPIFKVLHDQKITFVTFDNSGDLLASCSQDGSIRCWDGKSGVPRSAPLTHSSVARECAFSSDSKHLYSIGSDRFLKIWELESGELVHSVDCGEQPVQLSVKGDRIAVISHSGNTRLWRKRIDSKNELELEPDFDLNDPAIQAGAFFSFNKQGSIGAMCGGWLSRVSPHAGAVTLWDLSDGTLLAPRLFHDGYVRRAHFDASDRMLVTASSDNAGRIINLTETSLSPEDSRRILSLYGQIHEKDGSIRAMPATLQAVEYQTLSRLYPDFFECSTEEISLWNSQLLRWQTMNLAETKVGAKVP